MQIEELQKRLESGNVEFHGTCHDCNIHVNVTCTINKEGKIAVTGGAVYNPKVGMPLTERLFFKCDNCFKNDKTLRNWNPCEVYSRIVGYLRPVNQWNKGKREEYNKRKEFII